jgi:hypothetical protein
MENHPVSWRRLYVFAAGRQLAAGAIHNPMHNNAAPINERRVLLFGIFITPSYLVEESAN